MTLAESINSDTGISLGVLFALFGILVSIVGGGWKIYQVLEKMNKEITRIGRDSLMIEQATKIAERHAAENPGVRVPDPRDPHRVFVYDHGNKEVTVTN